MNSREFQERLTSVTPEVPAHFQLRLEKTLDDIVIQEAQMKESTKQAIRRAGRYSTRTVALAVVITVLLCAVALAATQWHLFDSISFFTGEGTPNRADEVMQGNLCQETINNVEITVREAGYDGRTLFLQYSFRMLDVDEAFGSEGWPEAGEELLYEHNVGWWMDQLWFDGRAMDTPGGSFADLCGSEVPGEIIRTDVWRIENEDVRLDGPVQISLPIGECQDLSEYTRREHPEKYDADGRLLLPDKGIVTFTYDATDALSRVVTTHPNVEAVLPKLTAKVSEVAYTPLMTYITVSTEVNPDAMAAFLAENGDGAYDEEGNLLYAYDAGFVFGDFLDGLQLVDGEGKLLFPNNFALDGYSATSAEYDYPYIEKLPDEMYLAFVDEEGTVDMSQKILVKGKE